MRDLLKAERVRLCAVRKDDYPVIACWFGDADFMRRYDMVAAVPLDTEAVAQMIERYRTSGESQVFAIRPVDSDDIIGLAGFDQILWNNATAMVFIGIGDRKRRGQGLGSESLRLLLDFGFNEFNFHKLQLNVIAYNKAAIALYEKAGFVREGTFREFIFRDGRRHDMYLYGLLRSEWKA